MKVDVRQVDISVAIDEDGMCVIAWNVRTGEMIGSQSFHIKNVPVICMAMIRHDQQ